MSLVINNGITIGGNITITNDSGAAPNNISIPIVTGNATFNSTLTTSFGSFSGVPNPSYAVQWQRGSSNITGATNTTYTIVTADLGNTLRSLVTATNILGNASAFSSNTAPVDPIIPGVPTSLTPSRPTATAPLAVTYDLVKFNWTTPNNTGGIISGYSIINNLGTEVANTGNVNTTTIGIDLSLIDTSFTYSIAAWNSAGKSAYSSPSAAFEAAPSPGTNLGSSIGNYVGNALAIRLATTATFNTANTAVTNLSTSIYTNTYFMPDITTLTTYRTVSGGYLTVGGPFWSSTIGPNANSRTIMTSSGSTSNVLITTTQTAFGFTNLKYVGP